MAIKGRKITLEGGSGKKVKRERERERERAIQKVVPFLKCKCSLASLRRELYKESSSSCSILV